jgi:hypothetical protein
MAEKDRHKKDQADTYDVLSVLGIDPGANNDLLLGFDSGLGLAANIERMMSRLSLDQSPDPWSHEPPFADTSGPLPVHFVGEFDLEILEFTLELSRAPSPAEARQFSKWLSVVGPEVADAADDHVDDHISAWSEATTIAASATRPPALNWYFDAVVASPATVRRLIDRTVAHILDAELPATRLVVGHPNGS